jgi:hypothetical protein
VIGDQTAFRAALLAPDAARPEGLTDGLGRPAGRRFDVYRNNVAVSLTEALETAFPVIRKLVGNANFKLLAGAFLRAHPPSSPVMMFYGAEMPGFLSGFEPTRGIGYLPDVARLELALRESYHAAGAVPVDPEKLAGIGVESRLGFAPSVRLVQSRWPVHAIWRFNMGNGPKPAMAAEDVAVLRTELDPEPVLLPPGGGAFLAALMAGATLGEALDTAPEEFDLPKFLSVLIGGKVITDIGGER